jgi:hypothetical protein
MKIAMSVDTRTCFPTSSTDMPAISTCSFLSYKSLMCSLVKTKICFGLQSFHSFLHGRHNMAISEICHLTSWLILFGKKCVCVYVTDLQTVWSSSKCLPPDFSHTFQSAYLLTLVTHSKVSAGLKRLLKIIFTKSSHHCCHISLNFF